MNGGSLFGHIPLTKERVLAIHNLSPRRISFATTHATEPKWCPVDSRVGTFNIPFKETVQRIFEAETKLKLYPNRNYPGYWHPISSKKDFQAITDWKIRQGTRIFIRDGLDMSITLDTNLRDNQGGGYTNLGALESQAKCQQNQDAIKKLAFSYIEAIRNLPGYKKARHIAAVPARPDKAYDLPRELAKRIADELGIENLTGRFSFAAEKAKIKEISLDQKWDAWDAAGLRFAPELPQGASVILIDDKYQSGVTIQFVASKLYDAGAREVYGMCAVKTLRDTDNQD